MKQKTDYTLSPSSNRIALKENRVQVVGSHGMYLRNKSNTTDGKP